MTIFIYNMRPMPEKHIALWAAPRSCSTVFEQAMRQRKDTRVLHEPTSRLYYGEEGLEPRTEPLATALEGVIDELDKPTDAPILFVKDIAYHVWLTLYSKEVESLFKNFIHTFIIRHPEEVMRSQHHLDGANISVDDAGFTSVFGLHGLASYKLKQDSIVIDAQDLRTKPEATFRAYCDAVGIPFDPNMLQWKAQSTEELPPDQQRWGRYHTTMRNSTGVLPPESTSQYTQELPPHINGIIRQSLEFYDQLLDSKLVVE